MTETTGDTGFDMDKAVDTIGADLGFETETKPDEVQEVEETAETTNPVETEVEQTEPTIRAAPKSWAKEYHEHWAKIDPKAQEIIELREKNFLDGIEQYKGDAGFGKQIRDVIAPYSALIQSQGADATKAVQFLLNAHYKLSTAQPAERQAYLSQLAKSYGVDLGVKTDETPVDPRVKEVQDRLNKLETSLTTREQAALTEAKTRVSKDVEAFASDPAHPYFDEVADDIVAMIGAGHELDKAYEKAVWANPVTRQKEIARIQTENEAKLRDKGKQEAEKARKASGNNVRSRDTRKAPTEPKGSMEDTMRETLSEIKSRTH